jgi:hypothetical protein
MSATRPIRPRASPHWRPVHLWSAETWPSTRPSLTAHWPHVCTSAAVAGPTPEGGEEVRCPGSTSTRTSSASIGSPRGSRMGSTRVGRAACRGARSGVAADPSPIWPGDVWSGGGVRRRILRGRTETRFTLGFVSPPGVAAQSTPVAVTLWGTAAAAACPLSISRCRRPG